MNFDPDTHPAILPPGYRIVSRFYVLPIEVAGRYRWCEHVRVVQRYCFLERPECVPAHWVNENRNWMVIGFYDEVIPTLTKPAVEPEWSDR